MSPVHPSQGDLQPTEAHVRGHFGELVQGCLDDGTVVLVTLPCPALVTSIRFQPARGAIRVIPDDAVKAEAAARRALPPGWGGRLDIRRPAAPGLGAGSSTAEILGTLRSIDQCFGPARTPVEEARVCLEIEGAVDPLMHWETLLFASREGRVVERLPPLPALRVIGGFAGPGRSTAPGRDLFAPIAPALALMRAGLAAGDPVLIGQAATCSARANQTLSPNPCWDAICRIAAEFGALGIVAAHTGSAIGLICTPEMPETPLLARMEAAGLHGCLAFTTSAPDTCAEL